ncbi:HIT family protein [Aquihabitans daechungensis]|uniref:HIT family protein n=1 Tax=Aquihabitans daechungensis TaxID=1052257 RepID=UPI003BA1B95F
MTTAAEAGGGPSPALVRLWAGWRSQYITRITTDDAEVRPDPDGRSLFERILHSGLPDEETYIVWRGSGCFAVLNAFPYGSGHLMVLPNVAAPDLADLSVEVSTELWAGVQAAVAAVRSAYQPEGVNVGINLGAGAGAGIPDHLHVHVLPRWMGDTNYMTTVAETRVLNEPLAVTWAKVREAWPQV